MTGSLSSTEGSAFTRRANVLTGQQRRHRTTERIGNGAEELALGDSNRPVRGDCRRAGPENLAAKPRRRVREPVQRAVQHAQVALFPR